MQLSTGIRQLADPWWQASFNHPFVQGIADGRLAPEKFRRYLIQDRYYLTAFADLHGQAAQLTTAQPLHDLLQAAADGLADGEAQVRAMFFEQLAITPQEIARNPMAPTTTAYISHMQAQVASHDVAVILAGLLPCSWLYLEIGERLIAHSSPVPEYAQWIATYAAPELKTTVQAYRDFLDSLTVNQAQAAQIKRAFLLSSIYELNFWQMAWTNEQWPLADQHLPALEEVLYG